MVETERDSAELLTQIASVREALHSAAALVLETYLTTNAEAILLSETVDDTERLVEKTVDVFRKWAT
jgi:DNA-binding FrmR family transcriptional regulator